MNSPELEAWVLTSAVAGTLSGAVAAVILIALGHA